MALNVSSPSSDAGLMARYFSAVSRRTALISQCKDDEFDDALKTIGEANDP
jgi:peptide/nickel transport system substrate-binding protein